MADILIQPAVPSLFTHTESASSLIVDSPTADSNNNPTIHHTRTSPNINHNNNNSNNNTNNSNNLSTTNKYIGHVSRLRSVFTQYALTLNDLKPGEHRSRYSNHHHHGLASPTRGVADGADENSLSPPMPSLPLATTSASTIIERSRSLSNPRILDNNTTTTNTMRNGTSSLTMSENPILPSTTTIITVNPNDDQTSRFRRAKEMFQTLEEEATRTGFPSSSSTTKIIKYNDQLNNDTYQPDLMHNGQQQQQTMLSKINTEHIPDLIIDHRQQQQQQQQQQMEHSPKLNDYNSNRIRDVPIQFIGTPTSSSPTHSDRSFTSIPIHRTIPSPPTSSHPTSLILDEEAPYAKIHRKQQNSDQHYDFPADAIEQLKKHQRDDNDSINNLPKPSNEEIANRIVASILPSNILKRMDHMNTIFIKPTTIDRSVPKLPFQENDTQTISTETEENNRINHQKQTEGQQKQQEEGGEEQKWIDNPMLNDQDYIPQNSTSSSPIFYEKPGIPDIKDDEKDDDITLSPNGTRRVKFSNAPIRVYPTYSPSEYNRRNDDIDPFSASAEYELEKRIEKMNVFNVDIEKGPDGLGISVLGMGVGADSGLEKLGIFVKSLNPQGVIARDGRIQIGDQIIEVDDHSLVGVTHTHATSILKATSGLVKFVIGREKDVENSEILRLIQQSLQMDHERTEMSRALQHHQDTYDERHLNDDDGFSNLQLNDHEKIDEDIMKTNHHHHELAKLHEKNYDSIWPIADKQTNEETRNSYEFEILKERYESLEKTFTNVEKEKEYYQKIYEQTKKDFEHIEEKYLKAKKLIKELQDREIELRDQQTQQIEKNDQQQKRIFELTEKIDELEKVITTSVPNIDRLTDNSSVLTNHTKFSTIESIVLRPPDIPERIPIRSRTSSGQQFFSPERPPSRNTSGTSSVRIPSISLEKISNTNNNNKLTTQLDFEVDRSPLLNHSVQIDKSQLAKTRQRNLPSKRLSNPLLDEATNQQNNDIETKNPSLKEQITTTTTSMNNNQLNSHRNTFWFSLEIPNKNNNNNVTDEFIEVKDWTSDQCIQWLTAQEMTSFIPIFLNRNIDGEKLLLLDSTKMKAMGIKSSKDRDLLKAKLKELKHAELDRIRERLLAQQPTPFQHPVHSGNRLRSSSMTKLKERRLFGGSGGK